METELKRRNGMGRRKMLHKKEEVESVDWILSSCCRLAVVCWWLTEGFDWEIIAEKQLDELRFSLRMN
jgi:hypothetical protein